jgi:hypothetical protein
MPKVGSAQPSFLNVLDDLGVFRRVAGPLKEKFRSDSNQVFLRACSSGTRSAMQSGQ